MKTSSKIILALLSAILIAGSTACTPEIKSDSDLVSYALGFSLGNGFKQLKNRKIPIMKDKIMEGINKPMDDKMAFMKAMQKFSKSKSDEDAGAVMVGIGQQVGIEVARMKRNDLTFNTDVFKLGMSDAEDGITNRVPQKDQQDARRKLMTMEAKTNKKKGRDFLKENKAKEGVQETKSGLQYKVIKAGAGLSPKPEQRVQVHYRGKLMDGKEFDSSYKRKKPAEFGVTQVIKGWTEALQMMKPGAKYELYIPSRLAYGDQGRPGSIPPGSLLIFEVELLKILPPKKKKK